MRPVDEEPDLDELIDRLHEALADLAPDDPDRDGLAMDLVDVYWEASWSLRYPDGPAPPVEVAAADADRLIARLEGLVMSGHHPIATSYRALMAGLARLERYTHESDDRELLDAGIAATETALEDLANAEGVADWVDDDRIAQAHGLLAEAYPARALLDSSLRDLDRAVAAAGTAIARSDAIARLDADRPPSQLFRTYLAEALHQRWLLRRDLEGAGAPEDLDAAIDAWRRALDLSWSGWVAGNLGDLLRERASEDGDATGRVADVRDAVALLTRVVGEAGESGEWWQWRALAVAERLRWDLTGDLGALLAAAGHFDRALALDVPPDNQLIELHSDRVNVERLIRAEQPARRSMMRELIEGGCRALGRATDADPELRALFAGLLGYAEIAVPLYDHGDVDPVRARDLLTLALTARAAGPEWQAYIHAGLGALDSLQHISDPMRASDGGVVGLSRALASNALDEETARDLNALLTQAMYTRGVTTGDLRMRRANRPGDDTFDLVAAVDRADFGAVAEVAARFQEAWSSAEADPSERLMAETAAAMARIADPLSGPLVTLPPVEPVAGALGPMRLAGVMMATGALVAQGAARGDVAAIRAAAEHAEAVLDAAPPGENRLRLGALSAAGLARLELARRTPGAAGAHQAAEHSRRAMELVSGHHHPMWADFAMRRAEALRLGGDPDRRQSRELGRSALRGHAWQVFAQAGTEHGLAAARSAATDARRVAGWCLLDRVREPGVDEELVAVLDAGRGLVLRAVTGSRDVATRLVERGHPELAEEWQATAGRGRNLLSGQGEGGFEVPDELRLKVLHALGGEPAAGFEAIAIADLQAALRAVDADGLAYLLPRTQENPGAMVLVPVSGAPVVRPLPALDPGEGSPVRRSAGVRDLSPAAPPPALDELCAWAWTAAMGELIGAVPRRPARLVLVPLGLLGMVPWHAAFTERDGRRRHAVEDAIISYVPSARMLCALARKAPAPIRSSLVIGDPGGDLPFAGVEARAIHRRFYGAGTYFDGSAGSPENVLSWIDNAPAGPLLLHFACHGSIDPTHPADAHLVLAGGARLSALTLLDRARSAALDIAEVFLAACTSNVPGNDHDEVLSLATSFLAAGAQTVFGSLWPVPDGATSVLMFMVHHYLRAEHCRPAEALHRAQRWMLDPARPIPPDLPDALRRHCEPGTVFDAVSWAGFTHVGR